MISDVASATTLMLFSKSSSSLFWLCMFCLTFSISTTSWVNPTAWKPSTCPTLTALWTRWVQRDAGMMWLAFNFIPPRCKIKWQLLIICVTGECVSNVHPLSLCCRTASECCMFMYWCGSGSQVRAYWLLWVVASCQARTEHIDWFINRIGRVSHALYEGKNNTHNAEPGCLSQSQKKTVVKS